MRRVDILVLFLILKEMLSVSYYLHYAEIHSLYVHFMEKFYHKLVLNYCQKLFLNY